MAANINTWLTGVNPISPKILRERLRRLLRLVEIDRAVFFALATKICQSFAGVGTLLLIAHFFNPRLQGFYYTFASLLAIQSFVELGFVHVIINVTSHEWAHLDLDDAGRIIGEPAALSRLVSLGRLIFKWYAGAATIFIMIVSAVGYSIFSRFSQADVHWQSPWMGVVILTGILLVALPFNALLEGCNQVAVINQFRLYQALLANGVLWVSLLLGGGLWVTVNFAVVQLASNIYLLFVRFRRFFEPFFLTPPGEGICWKSEIWPLQWRFALSGVFLYFAFSLFTPVMFYYHGPIVAGQMGMTWQVVGATQAMAMAWISAKVPSFGIHIAQRDYCELDRFWLRSSLFSLLFIIMAAGTLLLVCYGLNVLNLSLSKRVLPPLPFGLFLLAAILMQVSSCQSAYLRAHKQEPLAFLGVVSCSVIGFLVWFLGRRFGPVGAAAGYLAVVAFFIVPYETYLWFHYRHKWHCS